MGFHGVSKIISGKFYMWFKGVFRVLQRSIRGVTRKIKGCFNGVLSGFQGCLKVVQWVFEESYKGIPRMFQGNFKGVKRKIELCSWRPSRVIQGSRNGNLKKVVSR